MGFRSSLLHCAQVSAPCVPPPPKITTLAQSFIQQLCHTVHSRNLCGRPVIPMACFITSGNFRKQSFWSSNFPLSIKQLKNIRCCTTCAEYYNPWLNYKKLNPALQICMITELCVLQHTIFVLRHFCKAQKQASGMLVFHFLSIIMIIQV